MSKKYIDDIIKHARARSGEKLQQYWNSLYTSKKCKCLSRGSAEILKVITWAHGENWRRNAHKSEKHHNHHGHHKK